jgi:UDP-3-O-[3-hydroxymyristoyl] glucosamine N-acyltransferase
MTLAELVKVLGGKLVQGRPDFVVRGVNSSALAGRSELIFAEDAASIPDAVASKAGALVVRAGAIEPLPQFEGKQVVESDQPRLWFARAAKLLTPEPPASGVHPSAVIGERVEVGTDVSIGPHAVIGEGANIGAGTRIDAGVVVGEGVRIGERCHIYPRVVIYEGTTLGNRVVVHAGAVLGADGFGYVRDSKSGAYTQFPQQGTLVIEDDVEIGANTTIDRGALKQTRIGRGTKTDNLVHVAHNCDIGEDVILVALTGISGSCTVGDGAVIAGQVGIGEHAQIGPGVILGGQAGVFSGAKVSNEGLKPGTVFWGTPARPLKQVLREQAVLARLTKKRENRE